MQTDSTSATIEKLVFRNADGVIERMIERPLRLKVDASTHYSKDPTTAFVAQFFADVSADDEVRARLATLEQIVGLVLNERCNEASLSIADRRAAHSRYAAFVNTQVDALAASRREYDRLAEKFRSRAQAALQRIFFRCGLQD